MKTSVPTENTHIELFLNCHWELKLLFNVHNNIQNSYLISFLQRRAEIFKKFYYHSLSASSQLIGKDPEAGKDWVQAEKLETEYEMIEWHYQFNAHELTVENDEGQGSLAYCSPWGHKELGTTWLLNNNKIIQLVCDISVFCIQICVTKKISIFLKYINISVHTPPINLNSENEYDRKKTKWMKILQWDSMHLSACNL